MRQTVIHVVSIPRNLHHKPEYVEAKEKELKNWDEFSAYAEVPRGRTRAKLGSTLIGF